MKQTKSNKAASITILVCNVNHSMNAVIPLRQVATKLHATTILIQEPYLFKPIGLNHHKVRGFSSATYIQPMLCTEEQRVATVILDNQAANVVIPTPKSSFVIANHIQRNGVEVIIFNVYFPPKFCIDSMTAILTQALSRIETNIPLLVVGDFNTRSTLWGDIKDTSRGWELADFMLGQGFDILNSQDPGFTFHSLSHRQSAVDIAFFKNTKRNLIATFKRKTEENVSDHTLLQINIRLASMHENIPDDIPTRFNLKKADWTKYQEDISQQMQRLIHPNQKTNPKDSSIRPSLLSDPVNCFVQLDPSQLTEVISSAANKFIPKRQQVPDSQPWWTQEVASLYRKKNELRNKYSRSKGSLFENDLKLKYQLAEQKFRKKQKEAREKSWKDFVTESSSQGHWSLYYRIIRRRISPPSAIVDFNETSGSIIDALKSQAEKMFPRKKESSIIPFITPSSNLPNDPLFTSEEVATAIRNTAKNKAPGKDLITIEMIANAGTEFHHAMTNCFNQCLLNGTFPSEWKKAVLAIVPKPGKTNMTDIKSYRPVSLLPVPGKILDKLITSRVNHHLESNNCLLHNQHGFRSQKSTITAIESAVGFAQSKWNLCHTLFIALDISSAFDTADHYHITKQLNQTNCPNNIQRIVQSYLTDRSVIIRSGTHEYTHFLNQGCPQGSIIGPTLWNLLYNSLLKLMENRSKPGLAVNFVCYADDALLQIRGSNVENIMSYAHYLLLDIVGWGDSVGLQFNASKTEVMIVHQRRKPIKELPSLHFPTDRNGNFDVIPLRSSIKYLGVMVDEKLSFNQHFKYARDKTNQVVNDLCRVVKQDFGLDQERAVHLYKACIEPMLLYGAEVWGDKMEKVKSNKHFPLSCQRKMLLRATRAYRTTPNLALQVICNTPPIWLRALMRYRLRQDILFSNSYEKNTPPSRWTHPSAQPSTILIHDTHPQYSSQNLICVFITWTNLGDGFIGSITANNASSYFKFGDGVSEEQVSLILANIALSKVSAPNSIVSIATIDRYLISRMNQCNKLLPAHEFYQECIKAKEKDCHVSVMHCDLINETTSLKARYYDLIDTLPDYYNKKYITWFKEKQYQQMIRDWQKLWESGDSGRGDSIPVARETFKWIPKAGAASYPLGKELLQFLTGHGCFTSYLKRFRVLESGTCYCGFEESTARHILTECSVYDVHPFRQLTLNDGWESIVIHDESSLEHLRDIARLHQQKAKQHHVTAPTAQPNNKKKLTSSKTTHKQSIKKQTKKNAKSTTHDIRNYLTRLAHP